MKIKKINTDQFNKLKFSRRELTTVSEFGDANAKSWGNSIKHRVDDTLYKYQRFNGILWFVEVKDDKA